MAPSPECGVCRGVVDNQDVDFISISQFDGNPEHDLANGLLGIVRHNEDENSRLSAAVGHLFDTRHYGQHIIGILRKTGDLPQTTSRSIGSISRPSTRTLSACLRPRGVLCARWNANSYVDVIGSLHLARTEQIPEPGHGNEERYFQPDNPHPL